MSEIEHLIICKSEQLTRIVRQNEVKQLLITFDLTDACECVFDFTLENACALTVYFLQSAADVPVNCRFEINQNAGSNFTMADISLGALEAKNTLNVALNGSHAHCDIYGLFVANQQQKLTHDVTVIHNAPKTTSVQNYKGIADDQGQGAVFSRVVVNPGAQDIVSKQSSKNMLLSKTATIKTQPELEIYADDVQCAHGATVGEIDQDALFYMRARGIKEPDAKAMLTYAFVGENIDRIFDPAIRKTVHKLVLPKIPGSEQLMGRL